MARSRHSSKKPIDPSPTSFEDRYPNIAGWVQDGWIEIGHDEHSQSFVRVLDGGGMAWEGESEYPNLDATPQALDAGIQGLGGGAGLSMELGKASFVPYNDIEHWRLVAFLDRLIDEVGEDEAHPLASLMELVGVLVERYEDEHVPELTGEAEG